MEWWNELKGNHMVMMLLCCGIPLLGILVARYAFNYNSPYLVWIALAICIGSHFFMMKGMHHHGKDNGKDNGKIRIIGMKPSIMADFFPEIDKKEVEAVEKDIKDIIDNSK